MTFDVNASEPLLLDSPGLYGDGRPLSEGSRAGMLFIERFGLGAMFNVLFLGQFRWEA